MEQIVKIIDTFDAPIGKVWAVLSAFGMEKVWIEGVLSTSLEGFGIGALRTMQFKDFVAVETLEVCDPNTHCVKYRLLDPAAIPLTGGTGTMQLSSLGSDKTRLEWTCNAETITGDKDDIIPFVDSMYRASVANIKRHIGC